MLGIKLIQRSFHSYRVLYHKPYASATTDTGFKQMLSVSLEGNKTILKSFLQTFVPQFETDLIEEIEEAPVAIPRLKRKKDNKHTFIDLYVKSSKGEHYIVEMQAKRHDHFDERALYYACYTYSHQLTKKDLNNSKWFNNLKPVIALQILDYNSNLINNPGEEVPQSKAQAYNRVKDNLLPQGEFRKHYVFRDMISNQVIHHLQLIQVELPRAETRKKLFPPSDSFTLQEWWISVLRHSEEYSEEVVHDLKDRGVLPNEIWDCLERLNMDRWTSELVKEYKSDIVDKSMYMEVIQAERAESKVEGIKEGLEKGIKEGLEIGIKEGLEKGIKEGLEKGMKEGLEKGLKEGKLNVAFKLLKSGMSIKQVIDITGLTKVDIEEFKKLPN